MDECRLCGGTRSLLYGGPPPIARCRSCAGMSLAVFPANEDREAAYQEPYYRKGSGERFFPVFESVVYCFRWLRARSIRKWVPGPGSLIDVGCGRGILPGILHKRGWRVVGTQLSRTAAEAAARTRGVDVRLGELPGMDLPPGSFDVATFFHVLEHVDRPALYLAKAHELLADRGLLVVEVPDFDNPGFRLLRERYFCVDYPNHLFFFTPSTLKTLIGRCGFTVVKESRFSLEYSPFTTLQNLLNLLPGEPSRLYHALMTNERGRRLRRSPVTWLHMLLAVVLAAPAVLISLAGPVFRCGNTMRLYCLRRLGEPA